MTHRLALAASFVARFRIAGRARAPLAGAALATVMLAVIAPARAQHTRVPTADEARVLVRPEAIAAVTLLPPQLESRRVSTAQQGGPFAPTSNPSLEGSPVEALVLTTDALVPAFERLAAWKTAKGVPTVVRTVAQVQAAGGAGSDLAETLRAYIRAAYLDWGVRFVLLGGDTEIVPARYVGSEWFGLADPVTDLYYACLDGDWNADGDPRYGEAYASPTDPGDDADLVPEVALGRAPVSTLAEADIFVNKTLAYERPIVVDYQDKVLVLAEVLSWSENGLPSTDGAMFAEGLVAALPPTLRVDRLYENYTIYDANPLTRVAARTAIDAGYGTVVHIGHGYRYTLSVGDASLDVGDAAAFHNLQRCGLFYMLNCTAAAYDFESFAETLLLNANGGAALVIGASRETFPHTARDYQLEFFRHAFQLGKRQVGVALSDSRSEPQFIANSFVNGVHRWTQFTCTLLGDPEAPLWAGPPRPLALAAPGAVSVGAQDVTVTVTANGTPVADARVCAALPNDVYAVATTDALGHATLRVEAHAPGTLTITATASDCVPVQATRAVTVPMRALVVTGAGLADDGGSAGFGNADGRLDAGETVRLGLPLRNTGTSSIGAVTATLTTSDPDAVVLAGSSTYIAFAPGQERAATAPFEVQVLPGAGDGRVVTFQLQLAPAAPLPAETRRVELLVHAARPQLESLRVADARAGNGDGIQDPNEEIDLYYTVSNRGSGTAEQLSLDLTALEPGLQVLSGSAAFAPLAPGATAEGARLTVREASLDAPHRGRLVLWHLQDTAGVERRIDLRPPQPPATPRFLAADQIDAVHIEWSPNTEADLCGYRVLRATSAAGPFAPAQAGLLRTPYLRDTGLAPSSRYAYRVVAVDSTLLPSPPGGAAEVSTNPPRAAGWPLTVGSISASSPAVADVDGDGDPEIVAAALDIYAWDGQGIELRDADQSPITWGLFYGNREAYSSVTLADLDAVPGKEIVATTWHDDERRVVAIRRDGTPLPGWPRALRHVPGTPSGSQVAPVVANLDNAGAPEILVAARDGRLYGWHANGTSIVPGDTTGVLLDTGSEFLRSAPAVADLDPARPGLEIVIGGSDARLHVIGANGVPLAGWPRLFGAYFASGAAIGDLDRDGRLEIVVFDATGALHALHVDGTEQAGFPVGGFRATSSAAVPSPALGDLLGDADLEIVACGSDGRLRVVDAHGMNQLPGNGWLEAGADTESSPILGDIDGDPGIEIVLGDEEGVLHAWNLDATPVAGFPIEMRSELRGTPTLTDANSDGRADLVTIAWDGEVSVWDLGVPWVPSRAPWPTFRGDVHRTGQFGYQVPTAVAVHDLEAAFVAGLGVRFTWRAEAGTQDDPTWRLYRAGPFQTEPLGTPVDIVYTGSLIGERRGNADLEFVDATVEPGAWYTYVLGWSARPGAEEAFAAPITVATATTSSRLRFMPDGANPMRPGTPLRFEIPALLGASLADVQLTVYDARGRRVRRLIQGRLGAGIHAAAWDGRDEAGARVASGVYVARIDVGARAATRKLTWLR